MIRWLLLILLLTSAALRLWQLDTLPPGLFFDEAFNGLDARTVAEGQRYPLYFAANNGREPAYIYFQALLIHLLGSTAYVLRLASAFIGIITVPIFYITIHRLLSRLAPRDTQWLALLATATLALSFWHVSLSRLGFRAILLTPVSALALYFFWQAWTERQTRFYLLAGIWSAFTLYTYVAARLLPVVLLLFIFSEWLFQSSQKSDERIDKQRLMGLAKMGATAILCLLPLFYTFYQNPELISARTADVSIFATDTETMPATRHERLQINLVAMWRNFYTAGDLNLRHNLPGRPVHDFLLAALFTIGWVTALWQIRKPLFRLILITFIIMALPSLLSTGAPHALRNVGLILPLTLLYAISLHQIIHFFRQKEMNRTRMNADERGYQTSQNLIYLSVFLIIFSVTGGLTFRDYFYHWANQPSLGSFFDTDLYAGALTTRKMLDKPESILITRRLYLSPQMRFVTGTLPRYDLPDAPVEQVQFVIEKDADPRQSAFLLWEHEGQKVTTWLATPYDGEKGYLLETWQQEGTSFLQRHKKWPSVRIGSLAEPPLQPHKTRYPLNVSFVNGIKLLGYDMRPDFIEKNAPHTGFLLTTYWQYDPMVNHSLSPIEASTAQMFTHFILGPEKTQNNGAIGNGYPIVLWQPGEIVEDRRLLYRHSDTPPGKGYIEAGLFTRDAIGEYHRIDIVDGLGNRAADQVGFGAIAVGIEPPQADLEDLQPLGMIFDEKIELIGWRTAFIAEESRLQVELGWRTQDRVTTDYNAFVHYLNGAGEIIGQQDRPPGEPENPTTMWLPDETIRTLFEIPIQESHQSDSQLRIGLYEPVGGRQLAITHIPDWENRQNGLEVGPTFLLISLSEIEVVP